MPGSGSLKKTLINYIIFISELYLFFKKKNIKKEYISHYFSDKIIKLNISNKKFLILLLLINY